jgi:hypothetical protein
MRVRSPENCLRNSYATYAKTFRSSGDVARAMGDAEGTVKRFYVQTLEPGAERIGSIFRRTCESFQAPGAAANTSGKGLGIRWEGASNLPIHLRSKDGGYVVHSRFI